MGQEEIQTAPLVVDPERALQAALKDGKVPRVYGNVFSAFIGTHDLTLLLGVNGVAAGVLNMSYPFARALGVALVKAVEDFEKETNTVVPDLSAVELALKTKAAAAK